MILRDANLTDAQALSLLRWEFHGGECALNKRDKFLHDCSLWLHSALCSERWVVKVAESNTEIVGNIFMQCVDKVPSPDADATLLAYVTNFYVKSEHRNIGIGKQLLEQTIESARSRSVELLIAWPSPAAADLYRRSGFENVQKLHAEPGDHPPMELII